jgi:hypothetical protein
MASGDGTRGGHAFGMSRYRPLTMLTTPRLIWWGLRIPTPSPKPQRPLLTANGSTSSRLLNRFEQPSSICS